MSRIVTKPTKWHVRPAKTQISLGIRWSESSLGAHAIFLLLFILFFFFIVYAVNDHYGNHNQSKNLIKTTRNASKHIRESGGVKLRSLYRVGPEEVKLRSGFAEWSPVKAKMRMLRKRLYLKDGRVLSTQALQNGVRKKLKCVGFTEWDPKETKMCRLYR